MSICVVLGAFQSDPDLQGEIDFDFFEESGCSSNENRESPGRGQSDTLQSSKDNSDGEENRHPNSDANLKEQDRIVPNFLETSSSQYLNKPLVDASCGDVTGLVQTTATGTIIRAHMNYIGNKCSKDSRKSNTLLSKISKVDYEISDDGSVSSNSDYESDFCSASDNSFKSEEEAADSAVSLSKCEAEMDELLKSVEQLHVGQPREKCATPTVIVTQNMKCRKNLSFTNEEIRCIDNDNQVLVKKIVAQQNRTKPRNNSVLRVVSSASVNRQRHQRQIELENLV